MKRYYFFFVLILFCTLASDAKVGKLRYTWRDDPSTTAVIGWCQESGSAPVFYLSENDAGNEITKYPLTRQPARKETYKGMSHYFVRLNGLKPNTAYYFQIKDSDGALPRRMSFRTMPNKRETALSIIAGGDSRNNRQVRISANKLVAKIRPHFVLFSGDCTENDEDDEWKEWLDDWQLTTTEDGQLTPVIMTRGNHEVNNEVMDKLFDWPMSDGYFAFSFADGLLRVYTLNSLINPGGAQSQWLANDLAQYASTTWRVAQYHYPMRPHQSRKAEQLEQIEFWAPLFYKHHVQLAIESDSHLAKTTWPLRPSSGPGSVEGFERDDDRGTVFIGEGCWGAPLREADDIKPWTRAAGSFNHFNWIWLDQKRLDVRTVLYDKSANVSANVQDSLFKIPKGIVFWNPPSGQVVRMYPQGAPAPDVHDDTEPVAANTPQAGAQVSQMSSVRQGSDVIVKWTGSSESKGAKYELQRSLDGDPFVTVNSVSAKMTPNASYQINDAGVMQANPGRFIHYRLNINNAAGQSQPIEMPSMAEHAAASPSQVIKAGESLKLNYKAELHGDVTIAVFDGSIKRLRWMELRSQTPGSYTKSIDMAELTHGLYFVVVRQGSKVLLRTRVVVE
jgi:acid phosphatase type 7